MNLFEIKYNRLFKLVFDKRGIEIKLKQFYNRQDQDILNSLNYRIDKLLKEQIAENKALEKIQSTNS